MKLEFKYSSYLKRFYLPMSLVVISIMLLNLIIDIDLFYKILFSTFSIVVFFFKLFLSSKYLITSILTKDNYFSIEYYKFGKKYFKDIKFNDLKVFYGGALSGNITETTLVFKEKGRTFLIQYQIGEWNKIKMKEVLETIKSYTHQLYGVNIL